MIKRRILLAGAAILLVAGGFLLGWAASRRLTTWTYADLERAYLVEPGDALPDRRAEILQVLRAFANGYSQRDLRRLDEFMHQLFPKDQHAILTGTETGEWWHGYESIKRFVGTDWMAWGDVQLEVDNAIVCSAGDAAWLTTIGTVTVRGTRRPIRLFAVLTCADDRWVFRHVQFHWDVGPVTLRDLLRPSVLYDLQWR